MLGLLEQPSKVDVFRLHLIYDKGFTPDQVDEMAYSDYLHLSSYAKAKSAIENQKEVGP